MSEMNSAKLPRRQLFVAPKAQGRLLFRIMLYCFLSCLFAVSISLLVQARYATSSWMLVLVSVPTTFLVLIPFVLYDATLASNRLVGPFTRVQGALRRLSNEDSVSPLHVRDNDDWSEWMHDFNLMLSSLQATCATRQTANVVTSCSDSRVESENGRPMCDKGQRT